MESYSNSVVRMFSEQMVEDGIISGIDIDQLKVNLLNMDNSIINHQIHGDASESQLQDY